MSPPGAPASRPPSSGVEGGRTDEPEAAGAGAADPGVPGRSDEGPGAASGPEYAGGGPAGPGDGALDGGFGGAAGSGDPGASFTVDLPRAMGAG